MSILETFIQTQIYAFLLIFARIGCAFMSLPGFSDSTVPMNIRLYLALAFSVVLTPVLYQYIPAEPGSALGFAILVGKEMLIGFFLGIMSQIMMTALSLAGIIVAHITSLSSSYTFNPQQAQQLTVISSFFALLAVTMIFVSDLHHMLLLGLIDSYHIFPVNNPLPANDMADIYAQSLSESFHIGLMMSAPFLVAGFGIFIGMGLVARFVPQIQVFMLSIPVQVVVGLTVLATSFSAIMLYFIQEYEDFWRHLFA
jgi:flagellar biosynthetic protein FliR